MDPIVRVQARNLRVRLGRYYAGAGANHPDCHRITQTDLRAGVPRAGREAGAGGRQQRQECLCLELLHFPDHGWRVSVAWGRRFRLPCTGIPALLNPKIFAARNDFSCRFPLQFVDLL